jgi:hypothetical protein
MGFVPKYFDYVFGRSDDFFGREKRTVYYGDGSRRTLKRFDTWARAHSEFYTDPLRVEENPNGQTPTYRASP